GRHLAGHRAILAAPLAEAPVEHGDAIEAERAEHPPKPRRPHHRAGAVGDHAAVGSDACRSELLRGDLGGRHHKRKAGAGRRELFDKVEEDRTRNVALAESVAAALDAVPGALRFSIQEHGHVEDAQIRCSEMRRQPFRADEWSDHRYSSFPPTGGRTYLWCRALRDESDLEDR